MHTTYENKTSSTGLKVIGFFFGGVIFPVAVYYITKHLDTPPEKISVEFVPSSTGKHDTTIVKIVPANEPPIKDNKPPPATEKVPEKSLKIWIVSEFIEDRNVLADNLEDLGFSNIEVNPEEYLLNKNVFNTVYFKSEVSKSSLFKEVKKCVAKTKKANSFESFRFIKAERAKGRLPRKIFSENDDVDVLIVI